MEKQSSNEVKDLAGVTTERADEASDSVSGQPPWIRRLAQRIRHHQMKGYNMYTEDQLVAAIADEFAAREHANTQASNSAASAGTAKQSR